MNLLGTQTFINGVQTQIFSVEQEDSEKLFPPFAPEDIHKGHRGHLWVCAGSPGFWGSGTMSARAAVRCGAGYSTLVSTHPEVHQLAMLYPELLTAQLNNPGLLWKSIKNPTAIIVGPGFGVNEKLEKFFEFLLTKAEALPVIIDADALTVLARLAKGGPLALPPQWILTPHEGEMAKLLKVPSEEIRAGREAAIAEAHNRFKCTILLKGHQSLVMSDSSKMFLISVGNPVLAKAGTGDVLAGMIGGLLAQGYKSVDACLLGSYWHGAFGDWYIKKIGMEFSLRASEISDLLPSFWKDNYAVFMGS